MTKSILFIINPISGSKKGVLAKAIIEKTIDSTKFSHTTVQTEYGGHATELAIENHDKYNIIVAVGGDGTINEVAKGLAGFKTLMGIIPCGSGNGLARHLNIPLNLNKAIQAVFNDTYKQIDTCILNDNFFINVAGTGFDAFVAHVFNSGSNRGLINYVKITVKEFFKYKSKTYTIKVDNETIEKTAFSICFANSTQFGNNAYIAPTADISDGLIDLVIIKKFPLWKSPLLAVRLFNKTMHKSKYIETIKTSKATISSTGNNYVHIDGESKEVAFPVTIEVSSKKLMIVC